MAIKNYNTINAMILGKTETTGSSNLTVDYLLDALGSVVGTENREGLMNTYRYAGYGQTISKTGSSADPPFQWVGGAGYRQLGLTYVRMRHYTVGVMGFSGRARWKEILKGERPYCYALNSPATLIDPSGLIVQICHRGISTGRTTEFGDSCGISHWGLNVNQHKCGMIQFNQFGIHVDPVDDLGREENWDHPDVPYRPPSGPPVGSGPPAIPLYASNPPKIIRVPDKSPWRCRTIAATAAQERCLCENAKYAKYGARMDGTTWLPRDSDPTWKNVDFCDESSRVHDCQGFVVRLLKKCGLSSPWDRTHDVLRNIIDSGPLSPDLPHPFRGNPFDDY